MSEIRFLFGNTPVEIISKTALNSWKVKDNNGNYFLACTANLWKRPRLDNIKKQIEHIQEKREYKNSPDVRAVLAQVRREQRLRKKQKVSVRLSREVD